MNELALFAGAGGGILGGHLLGWTTVGAVEIEPYPRECLLQRQRDGILPPFPVWDDVCTFNGKPWRGLVDIISGGFPCQDISSAGKGAGITGTRSGLWKEMHRIICEVRPRYAFMENSPMLTSRGLGTVLGDLAESGYNAAWLVLGADDMGAPHVRKRIWILALDSNTDSVQCPECGQQHKRAEELAGSSMDRLEAGPEMANSSFSQRKRVDSKPLQYKSAHSRLGDSGSVGKTRHPWQTEPAVGRVADGVAHRVDRLKAIGNGQVPLVAATAFETLKNILLHENLHH